jgi:hypothetical protein
MSDRAKKVSELTVTASVANGDLFIIGKVAANTTNTVTANSLVTYVAGKITKISNGSSNVSVTGANGTVTVRSYANTWTYETNGTLTLPNGTKLYAGYPTSPYAETTATLAANQVYLATTTGASWIGIENSYAGILIDGAQGSAAYWQFDNTKIMTIPGTIKAPQTTKASNANGVAGEICWDTNYIYVCITTNTWKRATLNSY